MKICVILISAIFHLASGSEEFLAGTFLLTQKSLNEAPYRYAGVLRQILDKVEQKDPPAKYDEDDCETKYRILPSGIVFLVSIVSILYLLFDLFGLFLKMIFMFLLITLPCKCNFYFAWSLFISYILKANWPK